MANQGLTQDRWGVVLALFAFDPSYGFVVRRAVDDGTGEPNEALPFEFFDVEPGIGYFVDDRAAQDAIYHYSVAHRRGGYVDSEWTSWFAAVAAKIPDVLPPLPPEPLMSADLFIDDVTGDVTITVDGSSRVRSVQWELALDDYPAKHGVGATVTNTDLSGNATIPTGFIVPEGGAAYLTISFFDEVGGAGWYLGTIRRSEKRPPLPVDCLPTLDEDDGVLNLYPGRTTTALSVRYVVKTDGVKPDLAEVQAGTVSAADEILGIHAFTQDGEKVYVGVVAYSGDDGTGEEGPLHVRAHTYHDADNLPAVTWRRVAPPSASGGDAGGLEAVEFQVTDDSDQVALWVQTVASGANAAAWSGASHRYIDPDGAASATGYSSDPLRRIVEVARPAPGDPGIDIVFRGEDGAGNFTKDQRLRVDGDIFPSGWFAAGSVRPGEIPDIRPTSIDPDTGSWRLRVQLVPEGQNTFDLPAFTDSPSDDEFSGSTFGEPVPLDAVHAIPDGMQLNVAGWFFATTSSAALNQSLSLRSPLVQIVVTPTGSEPRGVELVSHEWRRTYTFPPAPTLATMQLRLTLRCAELVESVRTELVTDEGTTVRDTDVTPVDGLVVLTVPASGGGSYNFFDPINGMETLVSLDVTGYDATGGGGGAGKAGPTRRVLENMLAGTGPTAARVIATDDSGDTVEGQVLRVGTDGRGEGLFEVSAVPDGAALTLRGYVSKGNASGSITPDYREGHAQHYTATGALTLQAPSNFPPGRTMSLRLSLGAHALSFAAGTFYATDGVTAADFVGDCLLYLECQAAGRIAVGAAVNMVAL